MAGRTGGSEQGKGTLVGGLQGNRSNACRSMVEGEHSMSGVVGMINREAELVGICKEIVSLVKAVFIVYVLILFVATLILIVQLVK